MALPGRTLLGGSSNPASTWSEIKSLLENAPDGTTVFIASGTYTMTSDLSVSANNLTVQAIGSGAIFDGGGSAAGQINFGIQILGKAGGTTQRWNGVSVIGSLDNANHTDVQKTHALWVRGDIADGPINLFWNGGILYTGGYYEDDASSPVSTASAVFVDGRNNFDVVCTLRNVTMGNSEVADSCTDGCSVHATGAGTGSVVVYCHNCTFVNCREQGPTAHEGQSLLCYNCTISGCPAGAEGADSGTYQLLDNCTLTHHASGSHVVNVGAGVTMHMRNCTITSDVVNVAITVASAGILNMVGCTVNKGGAGYSLVNNSGATAYITDCDFKQTAALGTGGANDKMVTNAGTMHLRRCRLRGTVAGAFPGVNSYLFYATAGLTVVEGNEFILPPTLGTVYCARIQTTTAQSSFSHNTCVSYRTSGTDRGLYMITGGATLTVRGNIFDGFTSMNMRIDALANYTGNALSGHNIFHKASAGGQYVFDDGTGTEAVSYATGDLTGTGATNDPLFTTMGTFTSHDLTLQAASPGHTSQDAASAYQKPSYALALGSSGAGSVSAIPSEHGSVPGPTDRGCYISQSQVVQLIADADANHRFTGWSGDASGTHPVTSVIWDADLDIQAQFTGSTDDPFVV